LKKILLCPDDITDLFNVLPNVKSTNFDVSHCTSGLVFNDESSQWEMNELIRCWEEIGFVILGNGHPIN
jgi:hypothetical protein